MTILSDDAVLLDGETFAEWRERFDRALAGIQGACRLCDGTRGSKADALEEFISRRSAEIMVLEAKIAYVQQKIREAQLPSRPNGIVTPEN